MTTSGESSPLEGPAKPLPDQDRSSESPDRQVEAFLATNHALFENVCDRWANLKRITQEEYIPALNTPGLPIIYDSQEMHQVEQILHKSGHGNRRSRNIRPQDLAQSRKSAPKVNEEVYELSIFSADFYRTEVQEHLDMPETEVTEKAEAYCRSRIAELLPRYGDQLNNDEVRRIKETHDKAEIAVVTGYILGYHAQHKALSAVEELLNQDDLVFPFLDKIPDFAQAAQAGDTAPRGFLEAMATHAFEYKGENVVRNAVLRVINSSSQIRADFAAHFLAGEESAKQARKHHLADLIGVQLLTKIIVDDYEKPFQDLVGKVSQRFEDFAELQTLFETFKTNYSTNYWHGIKELLKPFEKHGRIPPKEHPSILPGVTSGDSSGLPPKLQYERHRRSDRQLKDAAANVEDI